LALLPALGGKRSGWGLGEHHGALRSLLAAEQQQPEEQVYAQSFTFFSFYLLLR
jgi:hypothetical protein